MKKVIIFIVVLFVGIFGARWYVGYAEEKRTIKAEKEYKDLLNDRKAKGDFLEKKLFLDRLANRNLPTAMTMDTDEGTKKEYIKSYLEGDFVYDLRTLLAPKKWAQDTQENRFSPNVGRFGPRVFSDWKSMMNPPLLGQPRDKYIAGRVLRQIEEIVDQTDYFSWALNKVIPEDEFSEGGIFGLHLLRDLEPEARKKQLAKIVDFQNALAMLGKLEYKRRDKRAPYRIAETMVDLADLIAKEGIEDDELALSLELDKIMLDYIEYLYENGIESNNIVISLQNKLVNANLSQAILNRVKAKRIADKPILEKKLEKFTNQEIDSLSIFESGFLLTDYEKWEILKTYVYAGVILNYEDDGEERVAFDRDVIAKFGNYVNQRELELELNQEGTAQYKKVMRDLESVIYEAMERQVLRHQAALYIAIARQKQQKGKYPLSDEQLLPEYISEIPKHPLTGKAYTFKHVIPKRSDILVAGNFDRPKLNLKLSPNYVVKKPKKQGFK